MPPPSEGTAASGNAPPPTFRHELRYDANGAGPYTQAQFQQHYKGSLAEWNKATRLPGDLRVYPTTAPSASTAHPTALPPPDATMHESDESQANKMARTNYFPPASPGQTLAVATANFSLNEHGSHLTKAPNPPAGLGLLVHGWNCPMPLPGNAAVAQAINPRYIPAAIKLANGLNHLLSSDKAKTPDHRPLVAMIDIIAYLEATSTDGYSFDPKTTEALMDDLEQTSVVVVHTHEPGGQAETEYLFDFRIEPR